MKRQVKTGVIDGVLAPDEEACRPTVPASAVQGTRASGKPPADNAAVFGVLRSWESSTVSKGGGVLVLEVC